MTSGQAKPDPTASRIKLFGNTSLLDNEDFKIQFQTLYAKLVRRIGEYQDHAQWWEVLTKPAIVNFCKDFSSKHAKERKDTKQFLFASLKIFLKYETWTEVARVKEELRRMLLYDMMGVKIRSRQSEYAEEEKGSIYHYNKERKGSSSKNLTKLRYINEEGLEEVTEDGKKIEELVVSFYDALFNGRHDKNLKDTGVPFQPSNRHLEEFLGQLSTLSEESKTKLVKELTLEELENSVKQSPNGKSPGKDGLPYELYKSMWDIIGKEF